jgi:hypothetical protein
MLQVQINARPPPKLQTEIETALLQYENKQVPGYYTARVILTLTVIQLTDTVSELV